MVFFGNTHEILAGRLHRSAQLKPDKLEAYVRKHNIKTVINLRGRPVSDWYPAECLACQMLEIDQEDISSSANRLPAPSEIRQLVHVFDRAEHPVLIHCQQGADRTGMAAVLYLLLYTDADYKTAFRQCTPRYGHFPILNTVAMDRFFGFYEQWLGERTHTPALCREWATKHYVPYPLKGESQIVQGPTTRANESSTIKVKLTNTSGKDWEMKSGVNAGLHLRYGIDTFSEATFWGTDGKAGSTAPGAPNPPRPKERIYEGRAGLMNRIIPTGESITLTLVVPALPPGKYSVTADLSHRHVDGVQVGGEQLNFVWEVK